MEDTSETGKVLWHEAPACRSQKQKNETLSRQRANFVRTSGATYPGNPTHATDNRTGFLKRIFQPKNRKWVVRKNWKTKKTMLNGKGKNCYGNGEWNASRHHNVTLATCPTTVKWILRVAMATKVFLSFVCSFRSCVARQAISHTCLSQNESTDTFEQRAGHFTVTTLPRVWTKKGGHNVLCSSLMDVAMFVNVGTVESQPAIWGTFGATNDFDLAKNPFLFFQHSCL